MNAGGSEAKKHVSVRDPGSGQGLLPLNRTDAEARKIIIARRIHARHFGRFPADERATCLLATFGYGRDDAFGHIAFQLAGRIVIKKEKRLRSLYDQVVDTHGDKVDSHAVVPVMIDRKFQLRADAVIGRNQQRVLVSSGFQIEKAAKTAEFSVCSGAAGGFGERRDGTDQRSEEHTSELQSPMRISYAVFRLKKKHHTTTDIQTTY